MLEKSIFELFTNVCEKNPDKVAYRYKAGDEWKPVTWKEYQVTSKNISKSLMALSGFPGAWRNASLLPGSLFVKAGHDEMFQ